MAKKPFLRIVGHPTAGEAPPAPDGAGSRTLIERTYALLRTDIVEGRLAPGARLRVEHLKDRYEVSAGTLREALTRLVSDALVVAEGQRGFSVAPITVEELADITDLRVRLETEALRQSVRAGDAAWRAALTRAFEAVVAFELPLQPSDGRRWEAANSHFHAVLLSGCSSPWTLRVLAQLNRHGERYRRYSLGLQDVDRDVHHEHRLIYEGAMAGQEARAALALELHIRATPDRMLAALRDGRDVFGQALRS